MTSIILRFKYFLGFCIYQKMNINSIHYTSYFVFQIQTVHHVTTIVKAKLLFLVVLSLTLSQLSPWLYLLF